MAYQDDDYNPFGMPYYGIFDQDEYGYPRKKRTPYDYLSFKPKEEEESFQILPPQQRSNSFMDELRRLLQKPQGPASSAYSQFLNKGAPTWQEPGFLSRLGASLSGMAAGLQDPSKGYATSSSIVRRPYEDALERYQLEGNTLSKAYQLEDDDYQRQIQVARSLAEQHSREIDDERQAAQAAAGNWSTWTDSQGNSYQIKMINGEIVRKPIGKSKLSPEEEIQNKVTEQTALQPGLKNMALYNSGLIGARQEDQQRHAMEMLGKQQGFAVAQQGRSFTHADLMQRRGFGNQAERDEATRQQAYKMQALREQFAYNQEILRRSQDPNLPIEKLAGNYAKVLAAISQDPSLIKDGIVTIDQDGNYTISNPGTEDLVKYKKYVDIFNIYFQGIVPPMMRDPVSMSGPSPFIDVPNPTSGPLQPGQVKIR